MVHSAQNTLSDNDTPFVTSQGAPIPLLCSDVTASQVLSSCFCLPTPFPIKVTVSDRLLFCLVHCVRMSGGANKQVSVFNMQMTRSCDDGCLTRPRLRSAQKVQKTVLKKAAAESSLACWMIFSVFQMRPERQYECDRISSKEISRY